MKYEKLLVFLVYGVVAVGFCAAKYFLYKDSFMIPVPHEHSFQLSEPDEPIWLEVNSASAAQLAKIPGVGRTLADRITAYRKEIGGFTSLQQLRDVPDFPESLFLQIGEYLYLTPLESTQTQPATEIQTPPAPTTEPITQPPTELLLNLNTATITQFCLLPGIGEKTAAAIVEYRSRIGAFTNRQQLLEVAGIGDATLAAISAHLYIENEQPLLQETTAETETVTDPIEIPMINLNTATVQELMLLPNCSEELAHNVIYLREGIHGFVNILEVLYTEGITDEIYISWEPYLAVDDEGNTRKKPS